MQNSKSEIKSSVHVPAMQQVWSRCRRPMVKKYPGLEAQFPACPVGTHLKIGCTKHTVSYIKYKVHEKRKYYRSENDAFPCVFSNEAAIS